MKLTNQIVQDVITIFTTISANPSEAKLMAKEFGMDKFEETVAYLPLLQTMRAIKNCGSIDPAAVAAELNISVAPGLIDHSDEALSQVFNAVDMLLKNKWVSTIGTINPKIKEPFELFTKLMAEHKDVVDMSSHITSAQVQLIEDILKEDSFIDIKSSVDLTIRITIELDQMILDDTVIDHVVGPICQGLLASTLQTVGDTGHNDIADAIIRTLISTSQHPLDMLMMFSYFNLPVISSEQLIQALKYGPESLNPTH